MTLRDVLVNGGRRGAARVGLLSLMAGSVLAAGCMRQPEPGPSKEEIWRQIYASRLENLKALDQAFNELGQEYYKLEIEYKNAGRSDLAEISRERAEAFHQQHLDFQQRLAELEEIDGRLRRGESALDIQAGRQAQQNEQPRYNQPAAQPRQMQSTPQESSPRQSYRAPSSSGYARPSRTPTPSRSGLGSSSGSSSSSSSRFNDPIIITDPKLNNR